MLTSSQPFPIFFPQFAYCGFLFLTKDDLEQALISKMLHWNLQCVIFGILVYLVFLPIERFLFINKNMHRVKGLAQS